MQYFDDMYDNKFGIVDANIGAHTREVYIKAINKLAEAKGSTVRLAPFDKGSSNPFLIFGVSKDAFEHMYLENGAYPKNADGTIRGMLGIDIASLDAAMEDAIEYAHEMDLDQYIDAKTQIGVAFGDLLSGL